MINKIRPGTTFPARLHFFPRGFGEQGNKAIYFRGTKVLNCREQGNKGSLGEQGTQKIKILILGNKGKMQIVLQGKK